MGLNKRLIDQAGGSGFNPEEYFDEIIYNGNSTARSFTTGFQPDLVWVKSKHLSYFHTITDSVRGVGTDLASNSSDEEKTSSNRITALNTDGFSVGTDSRVNTTTSGNSYWAWAWKAGGSTSTNSAGDVTSYVNVNDDAGFAIVRTTSEAGPRRIGHGMASTPELIIGKKYGGGGGWWSVYHHSLGSNQGLLLQSSAAQNSVYDLYDEAPTSTYFKYDLSGTGNNIFYCFYSIDGYQKIGSYVGNASTVSVTTGFQPRMIFLKSTGSGGWITHSPQITGRYTRLDDVDNGNTSGIVTVGFNSTGFSISSSSDTWNKNGTTFIYYAVA